MRNLLAFFAAWVVDGVAEIAVHARVLLEGCCESVLWVVKVLCNGGSRGFRWREGTQPG